MAEGQAIGDDELLVFLAAVNEQQRRTSDQITR